MPDTALPLHTTAPHAHALARTRWATRCQFLALGILSGTWGAHVPSLKAQYHLNEAMLSMVLLAASFGSVASLFVAGRLVARLGIQTTTALAALVMGGMLALALHWPNLPLLMLSMLAFGAAGSTFDVAINAEGTTIESLSAKPVMSNLHGCFSTGGMLGAALASAMLHADMAAAVQLACVAIGVAVMVTLASRFMLITHPPDADPQAKAHFAWPRGTLLVIGLMILAGMTAEGVMYDWCVLYLKQALLIPQSQAALGFAVFSGAMALARFGADSLRARYPEHWLLIGGASMAAVAMAVVLLSGNYLVALVGYALVGAGLAPVVPMLYNAATRVPGVSRAAAIAAVSSIGYTGFMIGPPLIGGIAHATSLTIAMSVMVVAATLLALGARRLP